MQLVPDGTFRKVRNNIDRLFDKNLTDLIRGIRNNKEHEARYIAACIEEIKVELRQEAIFVKANAIEKLAYLQMLGYDISWAAFNIIEVMSSTRYSEKRVGYLAAVQAFNDQTDVLMLTTNLIRKDLQSANIYDVGVALGGLACFTTPDLARDLVNDVVNLLSSSKPYVRKKAILLLYKIFLKYPESLRPTFARLRDRLEDQDPGVQSAAVNVICELARKNPRNYLGLQSVFFKLLNTSSNNWMLIKIIKLFGSLVPHEPKLGRKLLEPLTNLINSTSAMSLLYECINTVIAILISISSEGPGDYTPSIQLCVQKLGILIDDSDQNLKYLGLLAMGKILLTHPKAVQAHKDIVLRCLDDKDESIRLRALDLLYGMVSKKNIMEIVRRLMDHVDAAEGSFYRDELLQRIISICSHDNYKYITNFEWYISVLVELTKVEGTKHGVLIAEQIQDVTVRVQSIRHFSVSQMALLVQNAQPLLKGNGRQRNNVADVLLAAAWICGEFAQHVNNVIAVLDAMVRIKLSLVPGPLLSVFVQNIAKLYTFQLCKLEADDDWDGVESLDNLLISKLPEYQYTDHLEAQERTCNLIAMLKFVAQMHADNVKVGETLAKHFEGELNPVAAKAQRKVPVPDGLNLDECINVIELSEDEEEDEEEREDDDNDEAASEEGEEVEHGQTAQRHHHPHQSPSHYSIGNANGGDKHGGVHSPTDAASSLYHGDVADDADATGGGKRGGNKKRHGPTTAPPAAAVPMMTKEESRRRRQYELEHNPFYVKEKRPTRLLQDTDATRNGGGGDAGGTTVVNNSIGKRASTFVEQQQQQQGIQSPLEIAGVLGLERYMQQKGATLSWKEASKQQRQQKRNAVTTTTKTTTRKKGGSKHQQQQRNGNGAATVGEGGGGNEEEAMMEGGGNDADGAATATVVTTGVVGRQTTKRGGGNKRRAASKGEMKKPEEEKEEEEHFVYTGDGEMPEGALSSSSEEQLENEFRALDVGDLDEALREREQMLRLYKTASATTTTTHSSRPYDNDDPLLLFGRSKMGKRRQSSSTKKERKQKRSSSNTTSTTKVMAAPSPIEEDSSKQAKLGEKKKKKTVKRSTENDTNGNNNTGGETGAEGDGVSQKMHNKNIVTTVDDDDDSSGQQQQQQQQVVAGGVLRPKMRKRDSKQQQVVTVVSRPKLRKRDNKQHQHGPPTSGAATVASSSRDDYTSIGESSALPASSAAAVEADEEPLISLMADDIDELTTPLSLNTQHAGQTNK